MMKLEFNTREERAVYEAIAVRHNGRPGRWTMRCILETVHDNHKSTHEAQAQGRNDDPLVNVPDSLVPVIVGQLIERGEVYRTGNDPEGYVIALCNRKHPDDVRHGPVVNGRCQTCDCELLVAAA